MQLETFLSPNEMQQKSFTLRGDEARQMSALAGQSWRRALLALPSTLVGNLSVHNVQCGKGSAWSMLDMSYDTSQCSATRASCLLMEPARSQRSRQLWRQSGQGSRSTCTCPRAVKLVDEAEPGDVISPHLPVHSDGLTLHHRLTMSGRITKLFFLLGVSARAKRKDEGIYLHSVDVAADSYSKAR